jgi:hypothetical protein
MSTKGNTIGRRSLLSTGAAAAGLGLLADLEAYPQDVNRNSIPSDLKVTDMRIAVLRGPGGQAGEGRAGGRGGGRGPLPPATPGTGGASGGTIIVRIDTNQGISGYGQTIGDGPQPNYVLTLTRSSASSSSMAGTTVGGAASTRLRTRCGIWPAKLMACRSIKCLAGNFATRSACTPRVTRARTTLKISPPIIRRESPLGLRCSSMIWA